MRTSPSVRHPRDALHGRSQLGREPDDHLLRRRVVQSARDGLVHQEVVIRLHQLVFHQDGGADLGAQLVGDVGGDGAQIVVDGVAAGFEQVLDVYQQFVQDHADATGGSSRVRARSASARNRISAVSWARA